MPFIFYDTETTGIEPRFDQVLQFAAIYADDDLREIDSINLRCRIEPYIVPSPGAMMVTRVGPDDLVSPPLSHYDMICAARQWLIARTPAVFIGHNSIGFDEGFLRHAFYRTLHPLYLTNTGGSTRADTMRVAQATHILAPGLLQVPINERGNPAFKLGLLARANGIAFAEADAHDALADVRATLALARLLRARAPLIWSQMMTTGSKAGANGVLAREAACIHAEVYFGRPSMRVVTACAAMPDNDSIWAVFDLTHDPAAYLDRGADELRSVMKARGQRPLHVARTNNQPMLFPIAAAPAVIEQTGLNHVHLAARAAQVRNHPRFCQALEVALTDFYDEGEPSDYIEDRIYDGFPSRNDERLRQRFQAAGWDDRASLFQQFEDRRLQTLAQRLIFVESPGHLPIGMADAICRELGGRALSADLDVPWNTIAKARLELEELQTRTTLPPEQLRLAEIAQYLDNLQARFEAWCQLGASAVGLQTRPARV